MVCGCSTSTRRRSSSPGQGHSPQPLVLYSSRPAHLRPPSHPSDAPGPQTCRRRRAQAARPAALRRIQGGLDAAMPIIFPCAKGEIRRPSGLGSSSMALSAFGEGLCACGFSMRAGSWMGTVSGHSPTRCQYCRPVHLFGTPYLLVAEDEAVKGIIPGGEGKGGHWRSLPPCDEWAVLPPDPKGHTPGRRQFSPAHAT